MVEAANINEAGVDQRLKRSVYGVATTLIAMLLMAKLHAPWWSMTILFAPFFLTINLAFQALYKT